MLKRVLAIALLLGSTGFVSSCSSSTFTPPSTGSVAAFLSDTPFCNVVNVRAIITALTLMPKGGGSAVSVFVVSPGFSPAVKVNFGGLRDFSTPLVIGSVPVGTYDKALIRFAGPRIVAFDPLLSSPIEASQPILANSSPVFDIVPPLTVTTGAVSGLNIDFNMRQSISVDPQGNITGGLTPAMTFTPITPTPSGGFGELDDVTGFITSVIPVNTPGSGFIGSFSLQTLSGTAPLFSVALTDSTLLCGSTTTSNQTCSPIALNQLLTGSMLEMDGYLDTSGNLVANSIEIEDQEITEQNHVAFIGNVLSVTKDANGNATQFSLYVREEEPDVEGFVNLDSIVVVNLSSSTIYQADARPEAVGSLVSTNFANLTFDPTTLAPGQEVVVHGVFTAAPSATPPPPTTVAADKVYLKLQSHQGNLSSLVAVQSDDKTGAFRLASCSPLFQGEPILVLTNSQTAFVNLTGLSALTLQQSLLVKGLLFFELNSGTANGVTIPPGTLVLVAKQVHQLP